MSVADLSNDFVFSDPGRHLQQITSNTTLTGDAESGFDVAAVICFGGIQTLIVLLACLSMHRCCVDERRRANANANTSSELLHGGQMTTLAKRKQAIVELFEKTQVTMVSIDYTETSGQGIGISYYLCHRERSPHRNPFRQ